MKLKPLGSNMNQAHLGKWVVLFSYETPVAAMDEKTGKYYQTDQKFSGTTSRHLSKWLGKNKDEAEKKPQSFFNGLVKESVNNYSANVVSESMDRLFNNNYTIGNIGIINESAEDEEETGVSDNKNNNNNEKKFWYTSSDGTIEFQMSLAQAESVSQPGKDAEEDVRALMRDPDMKEVVDYLSDNMDNVKKELKEYGAWDDEELEDEDMNIVRMIWLAGTQITEDHYANSGDELEENIKGKNIMNESHDDLLNQQVIDSRDIIERIEELEGQDELEESEKEELALLKEFEDENIPEWNDGAILIDSDYWVEYVKELLEDVGDIPRDLPHYIAINWDKTADNISQDYSIITVNGNDWYYRNV